MKKITLSIASGLLALSSITSTAESKSEESAVSPIQATLKSIPESDLVVDINHHKLAKELGVEMPPCRLLMFNDTELTSRLLKENPMMGLDLPMRAIFFTEREKSQVLATDSAWLKARYGCEQSALLTAFETALKSHLPSPFQVTGSKDTTGKPIAQGFGILKVASNYDFNESLLRFKKTIQSQDDTVWFGEIDFTKDAAKHDISIPRCTLMLFGGPGPGGMAMQKFPKLGLDAFCQKVLLLEGKDGRTTLYYNSISDLAKFHYGKSAKPHQLLDQRISETYKKALTKSSSE